MTQPYPAPQPPKKELSVKAIVAICVAGLVVFCCGGFGVLGIFITLGDDDDNGNDARETSAPATQESERSSAPAPAEPDYVLIDDLETGFGREVTVAVVENEGLEQVFEAATEEYDAWSVTVVCASQPDPRKTGYILFGNREDGIVSQDEDRECPSR